MYIIIRFGILVSPGKRNTKNVNSNFNTGELDVEPTTVARENDDEVEDEVCDDEEASFVPMEESCQ